MKTQIKRTVLPPLIDYAKIRSLEARIRQMDLSVNTRCNYKSAWSAFEAWCAAAGVPALPATPQTVCDFITWCLAEGYRLQTVVVRTSAIAYYHRLDRLPNPITADVHDYTWQARRLLKHKGRGKNAVTVEMLEKIHALLDTEADPIGIRNWAMILVCFAAGFRRSELSSLNLDDVTFAPEGVVLHLNYSKTDQGGTGCDIPIQRGSKQHLCPVVALRRWVDVRGAWEGPLFVRFDGGRRLTHQGVSLSGSRLYDVLKSMLRRIGENPRNFGAHSLRAGMITAAAENGASEFAIMQRSRHKSSEMVRAYIRPSKLFEANPLAGVL